MNFRQRFLRYLIGVGIGTVVVFLMFPNYDWLGWVPEKRVMENIREVRFEFSEKSQCQMQCIGLNNDHIQLARSAGSIDFSASDVKKDPKIYHLDYGQLDLKIALTDSTALLLDVMSDGKVCSCPQP